jgi:hypothetical protein
LALVELSVVEQRYRAVLAVERGEPKNVVAAQLDAPVVVALAFPGTVFPAPSPFAVAADLLWPDPNPYLDNPAGRVTVTTGEFMSSRQREIAVR